MRRLRVIREENKGPDRHGGKIEKPLQKSNADDKKKRKKHIIIKEKDMKEKKQTNIYIQYIFKKEKQTNKILLFDTE